LKPSPLSEYSRGQIFILDFLLLAIVKEGMTRPLSRRIIDDEQDRKALLRRLGSVAGETTLGRPIGPMLTAGNYKGFQ
jgi:hypothetical protein